MGINIRKPGGDNKIKVKPIPAAKQNLTFNDTEIPSVTDNTAGKTYALSTRKVKRDGKKWTKAWAIGAIVTAILIILTPIIVLLTQPKQLTRADIASVVRQEAEINGFNREAGEDIAIGFVKSYLSLKTDETSDKQLSWYLSGDTLAENTTSGTVAGRTSTGNVSQQVIGTPRVVRVIPHANPALMTYRVTALVKPATVGSNNSIANASKAANSNGNTTDELKQITLSVTIGYDSATSKYYVATPNPSIVPSSIMGRSQNLVQPKNIPGSKIQNSQDITNTLSGFFKAYMVASPDKHGDLDQFIANTKKANFASVGLSGAYTINSSDISYTAYQQDNGQIIAKVKVTLIDEVGGTTDIDTNERAKQSISYPVEYLVTLDPQGNGKYLVSNLAPYVYDADTTNIATNN